LPPYGVTSLCVAKASALQDSSHQRSSQVYRGGSVTASPTSLENDYLRVEFNRTGDILYIHDKANHRDVLPATAVANQFQAFEDRPRHPDAWDIDIYYDDKLWLAEPADSMRVVESGPLRAMVEVRRRILNSEYVQRVSLAHNSPRLDFDTTIQWRERHILLKVAFPVEVLSPQATYEIQWGNIQRPTHRNTSWEWARFEACAQKWVDLSEGGYGVSLLNDCKYGHDIRDNVIRLTLLRAPTDPDPEADLGEHQFAYSLLPHEARWNELTVAESYALNDPIIVWSQRGYTVNHIRPRTKGQRAGESAETPVFRSSSLVLVDAPNVVIETIKQAENGEGLIVRLYESQRRRCEFTLSVGFPLAAAWRTNLLEENMQRLDVSGCHLRTLVKPYQIVTLRLLPNSA
jgi:alpha-mannosidase